MRKHALTGIAVLVLAMAGLASIAAFAQGPGQPGTTYPRYNPATEVTVQGTVQEVKQFTGPRGFTGTHVILKTDQATLDVHLGPSPFLAQHKFEVKQGDQLQVKGSKVQLNGADVLLAREVKKGEQTLTLRDAQGFPLWSRRAQR